MFTGLTILWEFAKNIIFLFTSIILPKMLASSLSQRGKLGVLFVSIVKYFVRHGKTEWNLEGRLQGAKGDSPLLKESIEQVRELGHYLSDTHFDLVFSSDLPRAKKTTELIMESQKPKAKVTYTKTLREWQLGKLEGQKITLSQFPC